MLVAVAYWLFILLTALGKVVAFVALVVFTIALPLARIQTAERFGRAVLSDMAVIGFGVLGVFLLLENVRIFLAAA
ncbi:MULTISPECIES: hypothetical protein [Azospirillum]|uniref:Tetrahydromethanopterin S-methyltransferase subunit E n=1 Tax=Azospirillum rugosum TaxID=416170 RepID=A0ABS4SK72_9PROT|nr:MULTISPECIES: hypothetical protein [Azospirillum]MBP2292902.1 tetrahydromethanopterin S-methyltransferase subunit E [Azospirillum rugosum]MCW2238922.1 tetrahydromethanopterin S-methyltransferase subunit E [Azospirillum canadense]MDQ0529346.1 tetrahydromethanopterin S-methyltransferase subunit E [Azospirillum rugosum]